MYAHPICVAFPHATILGMDTGWWIFLTQQMKRRRLSQADVARELGIPSSTVSRWRTQAPSPAMLRKLAPVLRLPVVRLLVEAGHIEPGEVGLAEMAPAPADEADDAEAAIENSTDLTRQQKDVLLATLRALRGGAGGNGSARPAGTVENRRASGTP